MTTATNEQFTVLIADDEPLARERIRDLLATDTQIATIEEARNGRETIEKIRKSAPNILFLDVQMPHLNGLEVLKSLGTETLRRIGAIIFITAFDSHALQAFEFYALDYLLKPFARERFFEALARAKEQNALRKQKSELGKIVEMIENVAARNEKKSLEWITVKKNERILLYRASEIEYIEAQANYAQIKFTGASEMIRETMDSLEKKLDPQIFFRIHRSTIVNVNFIKEIQMWFQGEYRVVMKNGKDFILSNRCRERFLKFFGKG